MIQTFIHRELTEGTYAASKKSVAELYNMDIRKMKACTIMLAELVPQYDRMHRRRAESAVVMSGCSLLQYLECEMCDETPAFVGRQDLNSDMPKNSLQAICDEAPPMDAGNRWHPHVAAEKSCSRPQLTKILQSNSVYSMLVRGQDNMFYIVSGETLNSLDHVERTTAECLHGAYLRRAALSESADAFEDKVLLMAMDGASSNHRWLRCAMLQRPGWHAIVFVCEDHTIFNIASRVGMSNDIDITGQIHWALAFNHPMGRRYCKQLLRTILDEWLVIRRGSPPREAKDHLRSLLRLSLVAETYRYEKMFHMMCLPNGDCWKTGTIEVWVPIAVDIDRRRILDAICTSLSFVLFDGMVPVINRNRWRGLYKGCGMFCLLCGLWGLGDELFRRFVTKVQSISAQSRSNTGSFGGHASASTSNDLDIGSNDDRGRMPTDVELHRSLAGSWLNSDPLGRMLVLRMTIEALRIYQERHNSLPNRCMNQKSEIFDVLVLQGRPSSLKKSLPFYEVISVDLESSCIQRVQMLLTMPDLWNTILPDKYKTVEMQELAFRNLLCIGGQVHCKLLVKRTRQPMKTFRVDLDADIEGSIVECCKKMHTEWSAKHSKAHFGNVSADLRQIGFAKRVHIACNASITIKLLESLHAQVRRNIKCQGIQIHGVDFIDLNAKWVMNRCRCREVAHRWRDSSECDFSSVADATSEGDHVSKHRLPNGPGRWRTFCWQKIFGLLGQRPDFKQLSIEFKALSD